MEKEGLFCSGCDSGSSHPKENVADHYIYFLFFLGLFTDMWKAILRDVEGNNTMESVVILLIGVLVIAFAVAAYILCIFPSNPTDDLVAAMHEKGIRLGIAKIGLAAKVHSKI